MNGRQKGRRAQEASETQLLVPSLADLQKDPGAHLPFPQANPLGCLFRQTLRTVATVPP